MHLPNEPPAWQVKATDTYITLRHENQVVGMLKPDIAARIVALLNDEERLKKALQLACYDLMIRSGGGGAREVDYLCTKYINQASRPTSGTGAIALWLKQRQADLDITDQEFERFCDSYRLLPIKLQGIYEGREIDSSMLTPLSRVLGCSVEEVLQVLEG